MSNYQAFTQFINNSSLEDEEKRKYLKTVEDLSVGHEANPADVDGLNDFMGQEIVLLENAAIMAKDAEMISTLADLRNDLIELQKRAFVVAE